VTEPSVQGLLAESFAVLAAETPPAWRRFVASLDGRVVELHVDDERFAVVFARGDAVIEAAGRVADARIATSRQTILDVLDARLSLRDAVLGDRLEVIAPMSMMEPLHEGILAYVHGGVRSPSFPSLLMRFRGLTEWRTA
jgi:hypothetical protein